MNGRNLPQPDAYLIPSARDLCQARVGDLNKINLAELFDCLVWSFAERSIFSCWMPKLGDNTISVIHILESVIQRGGNLSLPFR